MDVALGDVRRTHAPSTLGAEMIAILDRAQALKRSISNRAGLAEHQPIADALMACCLELVDAGAPAQALDLVATAERYSTDSTPEWQVRLNTIKAWTLRNAHKLEDALHQVRDTLCGYRSTLASARDLRLLLEVYEGGILRQMNAHEESLRVLTNVRRELGSGPDSPLLALCCFELSSAALFQGDLQSARYHALECLVSARRCCDSRAEALAQDNIARIEKYLCRWASAEEAATEALRTFVRRGMRLHANISRMIIGIVCWKRGQLGRASEIAGECLAEAEEHSYAAQVEFAALLEAMVLVQAGDTARALKLLDGRPSLAVAEPEGRSSLLALELRGDIELESGDPSQALRAYERAGEKALVLFPAGDIAAELLRRRAEAEYLLGAYGRAFELAGSGLEAALRRSDRYEEAATYRVLALSTAALGRATEAKKWFERGFAIFDDIGTPYEWGKLWMAYGDWLCGPHAAEHADSRGGREAYLAAHEHFERSGAVGKLAEAEARLARCDGEVTGEATVREAPPALAPDIRRPSRRPRGESELERRAAWARETFAFVTRNKLVLDLLEEVSKLANSVSSILILGESGTGKELIAHGAHRLSGRTGNFMPINCGALPREMIESELFGHVMGSFTGAARDKVGLFESCNGGTVFLDEIAEMSLDLQSRLLRFLETGELRRVGSNKNVAVDTLVIAATNRDKSALASGEGFRTDLYYRLAHAVVVLPPLRRRGEDIDLLVSYFLREACERHQKRIVLSAAARNRLIAYSWPGNVRQLRATVNRLVVLGDREVGAEAIQLDDAHAPVSLTEELGLAERRRIVEALASARGVRTDAAKVLGMSRTTLIGKMKRYGIQ